MTNIYGIRCICFLDAGLLIVHGSQCSYCKLNFVYKKWIVISQNNRRGKYMSGNKPFDVEL